ncbi:MAG: hypothetical protein GY947_16520 [Rhodobacteraceae bacterium]|nr:hypothetical protein [Paracoccaceae bacterium]
MSLPNWFKHKCKFRALQVGCALALYALCVAPELAFAGSKNKGLELDEANTLMVGNRVVGGRFGAEIFRDLCLKGGIAQKVDAKVLAKHKLAKHQQENIFAHKQRMLIAGISRFTGNKYCAVGFVSRNSNVPVWNEVFKGVPSIAAKSWVGSKPGYSHIVTRFEYTLPVKDRYRVPVVKEDELTGSDALALVAYYDKPSRTALMFISDKSYIIVKSVPVGAKRHLYTASLIMGE